MNADTRDDFILPPETAVVRKDVSKIGEAVIPFGIGPLRSLDTGAKERD
jgi:hypothetical protein